MNSLLLILLQDRAQEFLFRSDKIFTVLTVLLIIFVGLVFYLFLGLLQFNSEPLTSQSQQKQSILITFTTIQFKVR